MALKRFAAPLASVISIAKGEIGYTERPENRTKYGQWFGWDGVAWCGIFVSWVYAHAGNPLPGLSNSKGIAYVPLYVEHAKKTGQWRSRIAGYRPKAGDLIIYQFTNRPDHVEIVLGVLSDGRIWTVGGNTNAKGSRTGGMVAAQYRRSSIVGYIAVDNTSRPAPAPKPPAQQKPAPAPAPAPSITIEEDDMGFVIIENVGIFAKVGSVLIGYPDLASYARDRERSPGAPVMTISGKTATDMWPWLLRQMAAAAPA